MLQEAHRLKADGVDVVVGFVETHGRPQTAALAAGLEIIPRRQCEYHGITVDELDLDACLVRKPSVAIVDELAHTNIPGSRNAKRYQDVQDLLAAGIHVITAMNVQHLESLYNTVESLIGVKVRERVPDAVLVDADQVVNIDVAPEDLQQRLRDGKIYPVQRIASSLDHFFQTANLEHLRELALRELASQIDSRRRERPESGTSASDQIMVCLSSQGVNAPRLLRVGSRLAGRLNRNWYALYVQTPAEEATRIDLKTQRLLSDTLTLANQLGAIVFTFKGADIADTIVRFASEYRVGQIVIGKPQSIAWWRRLIGHRSVAERLIFKAKNATVVIVDADAIDEPVLAAATKSAEIVSDHRHPSKVDSFNSLLNPATVIVLDEPLTQRQIFSRLIQLIVKSNPRIEGESVLQSLQERESRGSTFLNEGIGLPHARVANLAKPEIAIAVTHAGILDARTTTAVQIVVLLLTPPAATSAHLQLLAAVSRQWQDREVQRKIGRAQTSREVIEAFVGMGTK